MKILLICIIFMIPVVLYVLHLKAVKKREEEAHFVYKLMKHDFHYYGSIQPYNRERLDNFLNNYYFLYYSKYDTLFDIFEEIISVEGGYGVCESTKYQKSSASVKILVWKLLENYVEIVYDEPYFFKSKEKRLYACKSAMNQLEKIIHEEVF